MENFFVPDLISIQATYEANPQDAELKKIFEKTVEYVNQRYDDVMETQFYMVMYSEGAMTLKEIDDMVVPERKVFLYKLRDVQKAREDRASKLSKGG